MLALPKLIPPFRLSRKRESEIIEHLNEFSKSIAGFTIELKNFSAFKPRVIFISIPQNENLHQLYLNINVYFENKMGIISERRKGRKYTPHMTVAFSDLSREMFYKAWSQYRDRKLHFKFDLQNISLLRHNGKNWEIIHQSER